MTSMGSADDHITYANPPLALAAAEIRFPGDLGTPVPSGVQRAMGELLGPDWVAESLQQVNIALTVQSAPGAPPTIHSDAATTGAIVRFATRERTTAVALTNGSITVETTEYGNWPHFRSLLERAVESAGKLMVPTGITRIGVRYINEIRIAGADTPVWYEWLSRSVTAPGSGSASSAKRIPLSWGGVAQYQVGEEKYLVVRYGPQQSGWLVNPEGPLRRRDQHPAGPYFALDFDAYWLPSIVPVWDTGQVLSVCDELREPARELLDEITTPRLVTEVFSKQDGAR